VTESLFSHEQVDMKIRSGGMYAARRNFQEASLSRRMKISFLSDFAAVAMPQQNLQKANESLLSFGGA
jgi:hypothetical protein